MNPALFHYLALALRVLGILAALMLFVLAVNFLRQARQGTYYVVREQARVRGLRLIAIAIPVLLVALAISLLLDRLVARPVAVVVQATAKLTATLSATPLPAVPSATPTLEPPTETPQPRPTATPLPIPTATASPTRIPPTDLPPTLLTPIPSAVPAEENASFGPVQFGAGFVNFQLTGMSNAFPLNAPIVHATFLVRNMNRNAVWTAAWYQDGKYVAGDPLLWAAAPNTIGHVFYGPRGGYRSGKWELRLYIEDRLQQKAAFTILNITATPTMTPTPTATAVATQQ